MKTQYKNALKENVKVEGFKVLNKWFAEKSLSTEETVLYNNRAVIFAFSINIATPEHSKRTRDFITEEFFRLIKKMSPENHKLLKQRII